MASDDERSTDGPLSPTDDVGRIIERAADQQKKLADENPLAAILGQIQSALIETNARKGELEELRLENERENNKARKNLRRWTIGMSVAWLIGVYGVVLLQGFCSHSDGCSWNHFSLNPWVLGTFLATTTGTVLGLLYGILRYLFPGAGPQPDSKPPKQPPE